LLSRGAHVDIACVTFLVTFERVGSLPSWRGANFDIACAPFSPLCVPWTALPMAL
jgi:hypothetical protein